MLTCLNSGLLLSNKQDLPALKWLSSMSQEQKDLGSYLSLFLLSVSMQGQRLPLGANGSWGLAMVGGSPLEDQEEKLWFYLPQGPGLLGNRTESLSSWLASGSSLGFPQYGNDLTNSAQARVCQRDCNTALHGGLVRGHQLSSLPVSGSHRHTQEAWKTQSSTAGGPEVLRPP